MIITLSNSASKKDIHALMHMLQHHNIDTHSVHDPRGQKLVLSKNPNDELVKLLNKQQIIQQTVKTNGKKYKLASKQTQSQPTKIPCTHGVIGPDTFTVMAGPCSVESQKQLASIAQSVKKSGAHILRGGAFKPRTAPYDFQGHGEKALRMLACVAKKHSMSVITEIMDPRDIELVCQFADILQVGARNMQNYALLKELGKIQKPVLLKRGLSASYNEFLLAAEYIMAGGNSQVILCERGIRTHVNELRFTLDLNAVPFLKRETHLPIIVDPSHGTGDRDLVIPMAKAALAAGADGLLIETHTHPDQSISDAAQTISLEQFDQLMNEINRLAPAFERSI